MTLSDRIHELIDRPEVGTLPTEDEPEPVGEYGDLDALRVARGAK